MKEKDPKKQLEAVEANLKLNEEMNSVYELHTDEVNTTTEVNMKLDEEFAGTQDDTNFVPTFLYNNTPPIRITGEE
ncbi:hypothetical protein [Ureibacillus acetophenoni]|uniref:Uncharacterized protein n=1 Tax=Ureibacillus acetophenoni TaxID=614649 RepID=A0A285UJ82_9BACL|nr:hypothetical protein [Ureibacillus acetophenoni]SOC41823.1 hypothetical protein SAMN05877842_11147 [Ureibacillus acetophenoni]